MCVHAMLAGDKAAGDPYDVDTQDHTSLAEPWPAKGQIQFGIVTSTSLLVLFVFLLFLLLLLLLVLTMDVR